ncbi:MAG: twin-arginine translocase TatA/TatE family subunit [Myxococcales bacterium]|nr:twin-arginine translocase TatA/TatE family subunit [Myxococcales bacterium]
MFGLGPTELIVIALLVVLLFGAAKIPELGRGIGEGISNFKKGLKEGQDGPTEEASTKELKDGEVKRLPSGERREEESRSA